MPSRSLESDGKTDVQEEGCRQSVVRTKEKEQQGLYRMLAEEEITWAGT